MRNVSVFFRRERDEILGYCILGAIGIIGFLVWPLLTPAMDVGLAGGVIYYLAQRNWPYETARDMRGFSLLIAELCILNWFSIWRFSFPPFGWHWQQLGLALNMIALVVVMYFNLTGRWPQGPNLAKVGLCLVGLCLISLVSYGSLFFGQ